MVDTTTGGSAAAAASGALPVQMRLNDAVVHTMETRLTRIPLLSYENAQQVINAWIERTCPEGNRERARTAAFSRLSGDTNFEHVVTLAVTFLQNFHSDKSDQWCEGFVRESMEAYSSRASTASSLSCSKGIKERVATGLRGIDSELDQLFAQAEGPLAFKLYCNHWNLDEPDPASKTGNVTWVANKLKAKGVTVTSTEQAMRQAVHEILSEDCTHSDAETIIEIATESVLGHLEEVRRILTLQGIREIRAQQDAEYAETSELDRAAFSSGAAVLPSTVPAPQHVEPAHDQPTVEEVRAARAARFAPAP